MSWQRHSLWCRLVHGLRVGLFMLRLNNGEAAFGFLFSQGFRVPKGSLGHTLRQFLAMLMMPNTENDMALYPCRQQLLKKHCVKRTCQTKEIEQSAFAKPTASMCSNPDWKALQIIAGTMFRILIPPFCPKSVHIAHRRRHPRVSILASLIIGIPRFRSQPSVIATATCAVQAFSLQGIEGIPGICHCFRRR